MDEPNKYLYILILLTWRLKVARHTIDIIFYMISIAVFGGGLLFVK